MAHRQVVMAMSSKPHFENKARERLQVTRKWLIARHVVVAMSTWPRSENEARANSELDYYPLCRHGNANLPSL